MSHELRTPLGAIKGYGTALLRFGPRIRAPQRREFLESINNATDRLVTLIDDLLLAQRLEAGALPIQREPVGVGPLVVDVIVEVAAQTRDYRLVSAVPDTDQPLRLCFPVVSCRGVPPAAGTTKSSS